MTIHSPDAIDETVKAQPSVNDWLANLPIWIALLSSFVAGAALMGLLT